MNTISKYIIAALFSSLPLSCLAIDYTELPAYEIEVVIFKYTDSRSSGNEIWPDLVETVSTENSIELHNNSSYTLTPGVDTKGYYYSKIPKEKFRLSNEAEKLKKSKEYQVLYHSAWIQPGLDKENAESIHIKSEEQAVTPSFIDTFSPLSINNYNSEQSVVATVNDKDINTSILEGVVKVELGRYLHMNFDLKYQRDLAPLQGVIDNSSSAKLKEIKYYPIQTHRRMRSKEVHYIDHPLIGILVLATRFELPKSEDEPEFVDAPLRKLNDVPVTR